METMLQMGLATTAMRLSWATLPTPLGPMLAVAADDRVCLLEFEDRPMLATQLNRVERRFRVPVDEGATRPGVSSVLARLEAELGEYFRGSRQAFEVPLALAGSEWQEACWRSLLAIPYGSTISYAEGAAMSGRPGSVRAFGRANGDNRMAILVPCHRVVGSDGALTGYGGGIWRKQVLLELEGALG